MDVGGNDGETIEGGIGEGNTNALAGDNASISGSNRVGCLVAVQDPSGFASKVQLDVKDEVATFFSPSGRGLNTMVKYFKSNTNIHHFLLYSFGPKLILVGAVKGIGLFDIGRDRDAKLAGGATCACFDRRDNVLTLADDKWDQIGRAHV